MKKRHCVIVASAFLLASVLFHGSSVRAAAADGTVTMLTANVGNATISEGDWKRAFKVSEYNLPTLSKNLRTLDPDIVFLQELDRNGMNQEKRIFSRKYSVRCSGELCTAVKTDTLQFIGECEKKNGYLICTARSAGTAPETEKCNFAKGKYTCTSEWRLARREILKLVNVHTDSPADDKDFKKRQTQICALLSELKSIYGDGAGYRFIASGDFNFDPYRYKSRGYERSNDKDALLKAGVCWGDAFSDPDATGIHLITSDKPTWHIKTKLLFVSKEYEYSLDHIITNVPSRGCKVLDQMANRIDVDPSERKNKSPKTFMDHSAVQCSFRMNLE